VFSLLTEAAEAAAAALAALPPSPFERIEEVWALEGQFDAQRQLVGTIFGVEDGPGVCVQALTLDDVYAHLVFARRIGLNNEQTKVFFTIMQSLHQGLADNNVNMEDAFANFKKQVMANAAITRKPNSNSQQQQQQSSPLQSPQTPQGGGVPSLSISSPSPARSAQGSATLQRPLSRNGPKGGASSPIVSARSGGAGGAAATSTGPGGAAAGGSGKHSTTPRGGSQGSLAQQAAAAAAAASDAAAAEAEAASAAAQAAAAANRSFSLETIKQLTEYATQTLFQHYKLYRAVFGGPAVFRPRTQVVVERLLLETPIPDAYPSLEYALELGAGSASSAAGQQGQQQQGEESKRKQSAAEEKGHASDEKEQASAAWDDGSRLAPPSSVQQNGSGSGSRPLSAATSDAPLDDSDEIGVLVHQHMSRARSQMLQLLQDNASALDAKIKQVETRLGVGGGAGAAATTTAGVAGAQQPQSVKGAPVKKRT
jgi:hypothetical protein